MHSIPLSTPGVLKSFFVRYGCRQGSGISSRENMRGVRVFSQSECRKRDKGRWNLLGAVNVNRKDFSSWVYTRRKC